MMCNKLTRTLAFLLTLLALPLALPAQGGEPEFTDIVVDGKAPSTGNLDARDRAVEDALRNAVQQAAGVFVDTGTMTENYELIADKILTQAAGYARTYKVIREEDKNGMYRVTIRAEVALGPLKGDLIALELLKQRLGYPRVMVIGDEHADNVPLSGRTVATEIENFLEGKGIDLVARDFIEIGKERDAALSQKIYDDYAQAAALGARFGAEVIVTYTANADYVGPDNIYGTIFERYRSNVTLRIVKVDTAALMASISKVELGSAGGRQGAARKSLENAGGAIAPEAFDKIVATWSSDIEGGTALELIVSNIDFDLTNQIFYDLQDLAGVKSVGSPEMAGPTTIFRLKGSIQGFTLAQRVSQKFGLKIDEVTQNRVKARKQ